MGTIITRVFSGCRFLYILAVFVLWISLFACAGGSQTKAEAQPAEAQPTEAQPTEAQPTEAQPAEAQPTEAQLTEAQLTEEPAQVKGSLSRTLTIVDELGRKSGTLTFNPLGGVVLRDENGSVIGEFKSSSPAEAEPAEVEPVEIEPVEIDPVEIDPAEFDPAEFDPAEFEPGEVEPEAPTTQ